MTGEEFDMGSLAVMLFWGLIATLIIWLIYTLVNYVSHSKSSCQKKNTH